MVKGKNSMFFLCFVVIFLGQCILWSNVSSNETQAATNKIYVSVNGKSSGDGTVKNNMIKSEENVEELDEVPKTSDDRAIVPYLVIGITLFIICCIIGLVITDRHRINRYR